MKDEKDSQIILEQVRTQQMPQGSHQGSLVNAEGKNIPDGAHQERPRKRGGSDIGLRSLMDP